MKKIILFLAMLVSVNVNALDIIELKMPGSDLVVLKFYFRNGSVNDPQSREGISALTANLVSEGGTTTLTSSEFQDKLYPWAAVNSVSVDKEVTIFTFQVHRELLDKF